ncbi:hypothetical protein L596_023555 [Steinernema carpocapsae]|uniref:UPAR/Ly6 domain-containing protein n=1 Tax=Steinernema carpocapsae TaxID=34508 RepID=A0A4U5ME23_STECR|nr:hypothetical protein L596_023555 [Steinernema carpocapsae]
MRAGLFTCAFVATLCAASALECYWTDEKNGGKTVPKACLPEVKFCSTTKANGKTLHHCAHEKQCTKVGLNGDIDCCDTDKCNAPKGGDSGDGSGEAPSSSVESVFQFLSAAAVVPFAALFH